MTHRGASALLDHLYNGLVIFHDQQLCVIGSLWYVKGYMIDTIYRYIFLFFAIFEHPRTRVWRSNAAVTAAQGILKLLEEEEGGNAFHAEHGVKRHHFRLRRGV